MEYGMEYWTFFVRWLHVLCGVMWIGLLWYFNFVQTPTVPTIPDELKPAIPKHIMPVALLYFRWAAVGTLIFGLLLAWMNGYIGDALAIGLTSGSARDATIGIGMWMGVIMAFNVWYIIWPNQQKVIGLVECPADDKPKAARAAALASRTNTMLSIPMLYAMVSAQNM
ncbi:MAG: urate hydroxylase PuuD [Rhodospirillales bacterium]|tara:strand:- start:1291 stop:1794 length:504 start_codon:yes stop_codon:yes gene_type:complete